MSTNTSMRGLLDFILNPPPMFMDAQERARAAGESFWVSTERPPPYLPPSPLTLLVLLGWEA